MTVADVSLLRGPFPAFIALVGLTLFALTLARPGRQWWLTRVLPIATGSFLLAAFVNWSLDLRAKFGDIIPVRFLVWAAMPLTALGLVVVGWRSYPRWQRAVAIAAVPCTLVFAANLVNQYYRYEPTLMAVFGGPVDHQVSSSQLGLPPVVPGASAQPAVAGGPAPGASPNVPPVGVTAGRVAYTPPPHVDLRHGVVTTLPIPGLVSHFNARNAYVWVPPAFFATPRPHLPVVMMLTGTPGEPVNMIRAAGAANVADHYAATHHGLAPILVFPDSNGSFTADTECVDGPRGNAETYLTTDVPAFVEQAFGALAGPAHWAVEGYSEGGTCSLELALRHPEVFGSFVDIAGDPFPNLGLRGDTRAKAIAGLYGGDPRQFDAHDPLTLMRRPAARGVSGWFEVGGRDRGINRAATALDAAMRAAGLQSTLVVTRGGHDFGAAAHAVADSFAWVAGHVGA